MFRWVSLLAVTYYMLMLKYKQYIYIYISLQSDSAVPRQQSEIMAHVLASLMLVLGKRTNLKPWHLYRQSIESLPVASKQDIFCHHCLKRQNGKKKCLRKSCQRSQLDVCFVSSESSANYSFTPHCLLKTSLEQCYGSPQSFQEVCISLSYMFEDVWCTKIAVRSWVGSTLPKVSDLWLAWRFRPMGSNYGFVFRNVHHYKECVTNCY